MKRPIAAGRARDGTRILRQAVKPDHFTSAQARKVVRDVLRKRTAKR